MGSRGTAPECLVCDDCHKAMPLQEAIVLQRPQYFAYPVISMATPPQTIVRGNGDFSDRERERLTKRSNEHWRTKGLEEARANVEKVTRQYQKTAEESHGSQ